MTIYARGLTQADPRNILPSRPYRWRGKPGWNPALALAEPRSETRPTGPMCGTWQGYNRHINTGEGSCDPCKAAYREYRRGRNKAAALRKLQAQR